MNFQALLFKEQPQTPHSLTLFLRGIFRLKNPALVNMGSGRKHPAEVRKSNLLVSLAKMSAGAVVQSSASS